MRLSHNLFCRRARHDRRVPWPWSQRSRWGLWWNSVVGRLRLRQRLCRLWLWIHRMRCRASGCRSHRGQLLTAQVLELDRAARCVMLLCRHARRHLVEDVLQRRAGQLLLRRRCSEVLRGHQHEPAVVADPVALIVMRRAALAADHHRWAVPALEDPSAASLQVLLRLGGAPVEDLSGW